MSEKSILEQALLQVNTLEEAVKQNAKGILSSVMKQELNDLLKESLEEEEKVDDKSAEPKEEEVEDMSEQPETETDDEGEDEGDDVSDDLDNDEPSKDVDSMDSDDSMDDTDSMDDDSMSSDDSMDDVDSMDDTDSMDDMPADDDDVMDMTGASDDEVLKVFKAMKPEDGIVVKKDGNQLDLDLGDDEYIIKLDSDSDESEMEEGADEGMMSSDVPTDEEETLYEIELDEEEETTEEEETNEEEEESKKVEATEAARTKSNPHGNKGGQNRSGLPSKKMYKAGSGQLSEEVSKLKKQNSEYKKALVLFKEKLNEVAVFNANLAYATRLFTEHSTTKQEKMNILKRFDSISSMNEAKNLYNTIKTELSTKKPVTESVVEKISTTPTTSSSNEVLSESKAYENPQFRRMKDLMSKLK